MTVAHTLTPAQVVALIFCTAQEAKGLPEGHPDWLRIAEALQVARHAAQGLGPTPWEER